MNFEKVVFGFFILLALTLNFSFVMGDFENLGVAHHHNVWILYIAIVVNLIATILKIGDRSQIGAFLLMTSLVADIQLIIAATFWGITVQVLENGDTLTMITKVVALACGAVLANIASVVLLIIETTGIDKPA